VSRAKPLFVIAAIAVTAGCSDKPTLTAPARANALVTSSPTPAPYKVTVDAPTVLEGFAGSTYNIASGVTPLGEATGVSKMEGVIHAVRWAAGSVVLTDVGIGTAHKINAAGQLAGELGINAVLWTPNGAGGYTVTNIGTQLPSAIVSSAHGINANGQVVGTYRSESDGGWADKCFVWTPDKPNAPTGTVATLPDLGGSFCVANDVNASGYVVGSATTAAGENHGFVWVPPSFGRLGRIQDLTPTALYSYATSINDVGQIAGQHVTETAANAAIWTPSGSAYVLTDLGTFTGTEAWAMDINEAGFVVGWARRSDQGESDAFIWQNGTFTLLPGTAPITEAAAITSLSGKTVQVIGGSLDAASGARTALRWKVTVSSK
jgi:probable HAF family extracellular repeat protein